MAHSIKLLSPRFSIIMPMRTLTAPKLQSAAACCFTQSSNTEKVLLKFDGSGSVSRSENSLCFVLFCFLFVFVFCLFLFLFLFLFLVCFLFLFLFLFFYEWGEDELTSFGYSRRLVQTPKISGFPRANFREKP